MSYLANLAKTYDFVMGSGKTTDPENPLIAIGSNTQKAQITVVIDEDSTFLSAEVVPKKEGTTITPMTISSASRTNKEMPHPLFDTIRYVGGDLESYYTHPKAGKSIYEASFVPYMEQLKAWCEYDKENELLSILYEYLNKKTLTKDLIDHGILTLGEDGQLENTKIEGIEQSKVFIRFAIMKDLNIHELWHDGQLMDSYGKYYMAMLNQESTGLCYITGKDAHISTLHGKYIRNAGDGAKLISSNDKTFFTFRGRFVEPADCAQISYEVSEKAHAALRWLIKKQAYSKGGLVVLAWTNEDKFIPQPMDSTDIVMDELDQFIEGEKEISSEKVDTGDVYARRLNSAIKGYKADLNFGDQVNIISLDAATPGRLSVLYYNEYAVSDYLDRIAYWHETAAWHQMKRVDDKKEKKKGYVHFIGAPLPVDLVKYAFGTERGDFIDLKDNILNFQLKRLLPCILEKKPIPIDMVTGLFRHASRPTARNTYNWNRTVSMACGLLRKQYIERKGVDYGMALNPNETNRSYLYGRLLAVADYFEQNYLDSKQIDRMTTAKRYMEPFSKRPFQVWPQIYGRLSPYLEGLPPYKRTYCQILIQEIMEKFDEKSFKSAKGLDGMYLLGYNHQMRKLYEKKEDKKEEKND